MGSKRLFLRFKKTPENTSPKDGLAGETATLGKRINKGFNPR